MLCVGSCPEGLVGTASLCLGSGLGHFHFNKNVCQTRPLLLNERLPGDFRRVDISGYLACEMEEVIDGHAGNQTIERHPVFAHVVIPDTTDAEVLIRPK